MEHSGDLVHQEVTAKRTIFLKLYKQSRCRVSLTSDYAYDFLDYEKNQVHCIVAMKAYLTINSVSQAARQTSNGIV